MYGEVSGCLRACDYKGVSTEMVYSGNLIVNEVISIKNSNIQYVVRRITPVEGERLQGFADNWTRPCFTEDMLTDELLDRFADVHAKWQEVNGKPGAKRKSRDAVRKWLLEISSPECPDGPRYKCIGNSMSVNVMSWIGQRIELADRVYKSRKGNEKEKEGMKK